MERKTGLIAALAGVAALGTSAAQAASPTPPRESMAITSYADLLRPVPNAVEALKANDAVLREQARNAPAEVQQADWGNDHHHHHHHHHHDYYAPPGYYAPPVYYPPPPPPPPVYYPHHHHHSGVVIMVPGIGVRIN
jgi:hypothetical protein